MTVLSQDMNTHTPSLPTSIPTDVYSLLDALPIGLQWSVYRCTIPAGGAVVAEAIRAGDSVAVSDASLKDLFGTASFVLEGKDGIHRIPGVNIVPGPIREGDSYRCELSGLIGAMVIVKVLCESHSVTQGAMTVACDNISTLRIFQPDFIPEPSAESFDLVCCLHSLVSNIPVTLRAVHVRGHALKRKRRHQLSRLELLNEEMDEAANAFREHLRQQSHPLQAVPMHVEGEGWSIWHHGTKMTSANKNVLYPRLEDHRTLQFWTQAHTTQPEPHLSLDVIEQIDYDATDSAMKALGLSRQLWTAKHASEN